MSELVSHSTKRDRVPGTRLRSLEDRLSHLRAAFLSAPIALCLIDTELRYVEVNERMATLNRRPMDAHVGRTLREVVPDIADAIEPDYRQVLKTGQPVERRLLTEPTEAGERHFIVNYNPIKNESGMTVLVCVAVFDVTAEDKAQERIAYLGRHDSLTGLANRSAFCDDLERLLAQMTADNRVALLFLDLDGFKTVNDTLGHPAGDAVLVSVSDRLRNCVPSSTLVSRFGGDEFAIAVAASGKRSEIGRLAGRIVDVLSEDYKIDGEPVSIGVSIGVALAARGTAGEELVRQADVALYAAKAAGSERHRFFELGMGDEGVLRQLRKRELAQALHRNELTLEYQPIVDVKTGTITAFEALLRWRHPRFATVPMESVIAIAEETGLIVPIGDWVLHEACREAAAWPNTVSIAVNVSVLQVQKSGFADKIKRVLSETGVRSTRLTLEITETVLFTGEGKATEALDDLRRHGVKISLDDFGKGFASLQYLKRLTVDNIKIDQSFVLDAHSNPASAAILRAVVTLAHALGISTVAEGIELASHFELLKQEGCDFGQGFFLGRPMSAQACARLMRRQHSAREQAEGNMTDRS